MTGQLDLPRTTVETTLGGGRARGTQVGGVTLWRGIPYAAPPVGELRFRAPEPPEPWTGTLDATRFGPIPPQEVSRKLADPGAGIQLDEDCLSINVTTPAGARDGRLPVMVYIYGGSNTSGSSALDLYDGSALARDGNVVIVSFNYRLGALGFLDFSGYTTARQAFDTNLGLRDQIAALEWVRDNIAAFGGDPGNVTIFGESAGGSAVAALLASPRARGLFHRAIAQSPAIATTYEPQRARAVAAEFLDILDVCEDHAAEVLRGIPAAEFVAAADELKQRVLRATPGAMAFGHVLDDILPERPLDVLSSGRAATVPLLIGTTDREGALFGRGPEVIPTTIPSIERMLARTDPARRDAVTAAYRGYPGRPAAIDLGGDVMFWQPSIEAASGHSTLAPTFMYRYDYAPRMLRLLRMGATHATDLPAVFGTLDSRAAKVLTSVGGRRDLAAVSQRMRQHWTSFAREGTPGPDWPRYDTSARRTKIFDVEDRVDHDPRAARRLAWSGYQTYR
ncbi:carboxylesterase/lipase family protein [Lolliginicoccus suaedae]|uniref:carboxylesterase/lipase family protein n=1 Tax=Lolliginicoccus suaedae TaxID=2605429 RepID=UPI001F174748|nr:carboxylesterase/lipase family protein [Lolliginicoccus suaedae]